MSSVRTFIISSPTLEAPLLTSQLSRTASAAGLWSASIVPLVRSSAAISWCPPSLKRPRKFSEFLAERHDNNQPDNGP